MYGIYGNIYHQYTPFMLAYIPYTGWWLGKNPSEKYDFVNWDDDSNPIWMGKCKIDGNQTTNQSSVQPYSIHPYQ